MGKARETAIGRFGLVLYWSGLGVAALFGAASIWFGALGILGFFWVDVSEVEARETRTIEMEFSEDQAAAKRLVDAADRLQSVTRIQEGIRRAEQAGDTNAVRVLGAELQRLQQDGGNRFARFAEPVEPPAQSPPGRLASQVAGAVTEDRIEIMQELARRGKLPDDIRPAFEEAQRRGLIPPVGPMIDLSQISTERLMRMREEALANAQARQQAAGQTATQGGGGGWRDAPIVERAPGVESGPWERYRSTSISPPPSTGVRREGPFGSPVTNAIFAALAGIAALASFLIGRASLFILGGE